MNYLQLVNRARRECGVSGAANLTTLQNPATVETQRFIDWVADAWNDIQISQTTWQFLRAKCEIATTAGQNVYTPAGANATYFATGATIPTSTIPTFDSFVLSSFRCYRPAVGYGDEMLMNFLIWEDFRNLYLYGNMRTTQQRPVAVTQAPDRSLVVGAVPDDVYNIVGEFYAHPQVLSADTDTPLMPDQFHMLVVYKTMEYYGAYESAPEVLARAQAGISNLEPLLINHQLPKITFNVPLA